MTVDRVEKSYTKEVALELVGCSYRQLDYWSRRGWISSSGEGNGSGMPRSWLASELRKAKRLRALIEAGYAPATAAKLATSEEWELGKSGREETLLLSVATVTLPKELRT